MLNFHRLVAGRNSQNVKSSTVDAESPTGQVVASIYCRLDEASKKTGRLVCREWKRVMEKYFLRFRLLITDNSYDLLVNTTVSRFDTLTVQDFTRNTDYHRGFALSCPITNLIFRQCHTSSVTPRRSVSESNMEKILWQCREAKTLVFEENSLRFIRHLAIEGLQFRNLTHLMITLRNRKFDVNEGGHHVLLQLCRVSMPVLSNLRLDSLLLSGDKENAIMYASLFEFATVHASTMKNLTIRHSFQPYSNLLNGTTTTTEDFNLPWKQSKFDSVRQDMSNLALTHLTLFLDKYEGFGQFTLALDLLASQYYLSKLEIHMSNSSNFDSNNRLHDLYSHVQRSIERNLGTLRHFSLSRCDMESPGDDLGKILRAAYHCSDLESVRLFVFSMSTFPHQLPPTIRFLELMGTLSGSILAEIRVTLPALEHLQFANLTDDYLRPSHHGGDQEVGEDGENLMMVNLKRLLFMHRRLRVIKWHCPKLDLNFISNMRGVSVKTSTTNAFASIITIHRNMCE